MSRIVLAVALLLAALYVLHNNFGILPQVRGDTVNPAGMIYTGKLVDKM